MSAFINIYLQLKLAPVATLQLVVLAQDLGPDFSRRLCILSWEDL